MHESNKQVGFLTFLLWPLSHLKSKRKLFFKENPKPTLYIWELYPPDDPPRPSRPGPSDDNDGGGGDADNDDDDSDGGGGDDGDDDDATVGLS